MKRLWIIFAMLAFLPASQASAATYYVSATGDGNDANSGTSPSTPWATLTKVNNTAFSPGDSINFKRGSTWTGTLVVDSNGLSGNPVTYQAYATGVAPIIQAASTRPTSGYSDAITVTGDYNVIKDFLLRNAHEAGIGVQNRAEHNTMSDLEITNVGIGIYLRGQLNLATHNYIHDLAMIVNTAGGNDDYGANCFWVENVNNEISYNRGINCVAPSSEFGEDGGFVECANCSGLNVHHNWAENTAGFLEAWGSGTNVTMSYNVLVNTTAANRPPALCITIPMTGFAFEHNTVLLNTSEANRVFGCRSDLTFLTVRNNIFHLNTGVAGNGNFTHTHNLYHLNGASIGYALSTGEKIGDPLFVNVGAKDFHLRAGSPAIDAGLNLGYTEDFDDNPVPEGSAPDMGAFESDSSGGGGGGGTVTSVNDTAFQYTGTWSYATGTGKYLNDDHYTTSTNAYYTYTFTGTKAQVFVATAPWHGRAAVSVDGGAETIVDLYSSTKVNQVPIYTTPSLPNGTHTVKVRCAGIHNPSSTGNYITADRIDITN